MEINVLMLINYIMSLLRSLIFLIPLLIT